MTLMLFSCNSSCKEIVIVRQKIGKPDKPIYPKVQFQSRQDGAWLTREMLQKLMEREVLKNNYVNNLERRIEENDRLSEIPR